MSRASSDPTTSRGGGPRPRLILVDDNIRDRGGHYFELASLLLEGAKSLGYRGVLGTNRDFEQTGKTSCPWEIHRVFTTRRMVRWSLGVDGHSKLERDMDGRPIGGSSLQNLVTRTSDFLGPGEKRPAAMIQRWSDGLVDMLHKVKPTATDQLLVNTGDDFQLLALAHALRRLELPAMRIDVIFHFALFDLEQADQESRSRQLSRQFRHVLGALKPHQIHLHATTDTLADQLRSIDSGQRFHSIPYPTRACAINEVTKKLPLNAVIAGMPRAEKGKDAIGELLASLADGVVKQGRYRVSMQLPADKWRTLIPDVLHRVSEEAMPGQASRPFEVITSNLSTEAYHHWLSTADLGLFLYDPGRYVARCSGVLLELLARGVPVIVPDHCWLASVVRQAGGHRSIGFIYQDRKEIPDLMRQFIKWRAEILPRTRAFAKTISTRHDGRNTLLKMGICPADQRQHAA